MSDDDAQRILAAIERLDTRFEGVETRLERLETRLERLESRVDRLETKQDAMRADIMERIDRLQHKVDETHDDIVVSFANTDRVERTARTATDDARGTAELLRVMQRQIMRLQTDVEQLRGAP